MVGEKRGPLTPRKGRPCYSSGQGRAGDARRYNRYAYGPRRYNWTYYPYWRPYQYRYWQFMYPYGGPMF